MPRPPKVFSARALEIMLLAQMCDDGYGWDGKVQHDPAAKSTAGQEDVTLRQSAPPVAPKLVLVAKDGIIVGHKPACRPFHAVSTWLRIPPA